MTPIAADANGAAAQPPWSVDFWIDDVDAAGGRAATLDGRVIVEIILLQLPNCYRVPGDYLP
jgi:hypothetical protein